VVEELKDGEGKVAVVELHDRERKGGGAEGWTGKDVEGIEVWIGKGGGRMKKGGEELMANGNGDGGIEG
jgi:hypothetical protein